MLRARGRRRLRILITTLVIASLGVGAYMLSHSHYLDLDTINVNGVSTQRAAEVIDAAPINLGTPLLSLNTGSIRAAVTELPWVLDVKVKRQWPGSLDINVFERVPIAALPDGRGGHVLVDKSGISLSASPGPPEDTMLVIDLIARGSLGEEQTLIQKALAVVGVMPQDLVGWVEAVTIDVGGRHSAVGSLGLDLVGSARVVLGDDGHVVTKLDAVRTVLASVDLRCMEVIDVRVADVTTVRRDPACLLTSS